MAKIILCKLEGTRDVFESGGMAASTSLAPRLPCAGSSDSGTLSFRLRRSIIRGWGLHNQVPSSEEGLQPLPQ